MEQPSTSKKNKKRLQNFSNEMKKNLAAQVKAHPRIWDITDSLHCRKDALEQSWTAISDVIGRPINECKIAWASLRESCRYYAKAGRKGKSGDAGGEFLEEPHLENAETVEWEFGEDLAFLPSTSQKRKTFQTFEQSPEAVNFIDTDSSSATYDYTTPSKRKRPENRGTEILDRVGSLLETQQKIQEKRAQDETAKSPFASALSAFDWMLRKLPQDVADETCEEIMQMLLTKSNQERAKQNS